jgi:iron complex transport system ATP-binding protein
MIRIQNLVGGYNESSIIKDLDLEINKGEFFALLGQNGSGKTTLFKLITGQLPIKSGRINISGKEVQSLSKLEKAKKMAVLTQEVQVSFDYTVEEIISLGRYPHQKGFFKQLSKEDRKVIEEVMDITNVSQLRKAQFRMISGGEKQRVLLAKALAQEPEILLLDEPTNHLDIKHTFHMLDLLKERQQMKGLTIFAILHDLNVASLYADRVALLHEGKFLEVGDTDILRKVDQLKKVYEVKVNAQSHPIVPKPQLLMTPEYSTSREFYRFEDSYVLEQTEESIHVQFEHPLRAISNGVIGEAIGWSKHFCHYFIENDSHNSHPEKNLQKVMQNDCIPFEQGVGMITSAKLEETVIVTEEIDHIQMMAIVTIGAGHDESSVFEMNGSINMMLFIDAYFTDRALMDSYMYGTEAKVKALKDLKDLNIVDSTTGTSTDTLMIGLTQQGTKQAFIGSGNSVEKGIRKIVYRAIKEVLQKDRMKVQSKG